MQCQTHMLAAMLLAVLASAARASAIEDCSHARDPAVRLEACTMVIEAAGPQDADKAVAYRNRGEARLKAGASEQAIADFTAALDLDAGDARAYAGRARARGTRGEHDAAIVDFSAALRLTQGDAARATLLIGRGHVLLVKSEIGPAIADFDDAIKLNPRSASARNHRGLAYRKKGDLALAADEYTAAISLNPAYALAYNNRGYVFEAMGRREEAIADFSRALLLDGSLTGASDGLKRLGAAGLLASESGRLIAEGKAIVEASCSFCHAVGKSGASPNPKAPEFRNLDQRYPALTLREPLSRGIAAPHDVMPRFVLSDAEIDRIIAYINSL